MERGTRRVIGDGLMGVLVLVAAVTRHDRPPCSTVTDGDGTTDNRRLCAAERRDQAMGEFSRRTELQYGYCSKHGAHKQTLWRRIEWRG